MEKCLTQVYYRYFQYTILIFTIFLLQACADKELMLPPPAEPVKLPKITTEYLLKNRIISYAPQFHEKILTTLPYEIENFEEHYRFHLVARVPDAEAPRDLQPKFYLWLVRYADNWRDFVAVYAENRTPLLIKPHYSNIRQGVFYEEYTIDLSLEQLKSVREKGLSLTLINAAHIRSEIFLPPEYIQAFLEIIKKG